ncbi:fimbria/pilus outer membrane usher protein [Aeromonas salmonicida]|uniref:fimbria/pilus outer membrane usher protein n=1 Tax=Aeromonas salmonicida TaxID=645 RepID=UPI002796AECD|nr:fimbria/pilus outer membrane usher protein [Aeromonas salmonicida]MDQ1886081.1 fimbria/pilus outer membrane usher protein [Aeromonas salmonicida]
MQSLYISGTVIVSSLLSSPLALASPTASASETLNFSSGFMQGLEVDLDKFLAQGALLPGNYRVDLFLNQRLVAREELAFVEEAGGVVPCLPADLLARIGVDMAILAQSLGLLSAAALPACIDPRQVAYGDWRYDSGSQRLDISLPLQMVPKADRNEVPPGLWDEGVAAGFVDYRFSSSWRHQNGQGSSESHSGSFTSGLNLGPWRLRNRSSASYQEGNVSWRSEQSYAERDITLLQSQLAVGEVYGQSQLFDAPRLLGLTIGTDEQMLPSTQRGYAPVVSGVAESNATVEIRQGGELLLTTNVPPGPFTLRDIPTRGSNGELEITIIEADGSQRTQTQGFGMGAIMVAEGSTRYRVNLGELDDPELLGDLWFGSGEVTHGLSSNLTVGGGIQGKKDYFALNMVAGLGTSFGAMSFDVTHSDSRARSGDHVRGQSYRARFSRQFQETGTTLGVTAMRYSDETYRSLSDHVAENKPQGGSSTSRSKAQLSAAINQSLPEQYGSVNLSFNYDEFWGDQRARTSLSGGYGNSWKSLNYNFNLEKSRTAQGKDDKRMSVNLSMPLEWGEERSRLTMGSSRSGDRNYSNVGVSGGAGDFNYGLRASTDHGDNQSWSANGSGRSRYGDGSLGFSQGRDYQALHASWNGSLVAHEGGLNLAPALGDGFILAEVEGTSGVGFAGNDARTGYNGYAVLRNFTPYSRNWIKVDSKTLPEGVELAGNDSQVVPRQGAVTKVYFGASKVLRAHFELRDGSGELLPFGTQLERKDGELLAIADPHGRALALLTESKGELVIKGDKVRCVVPYQVSAKPAAGQSYQQLTLQCAN